MRVEFSFKNSKKVLKTPRNPKNIEVYISNTKWAILVTVKKKANKEIYAKKISSLGAKLLNDEILLNDFLIQKEKAKKRLSKKIVVVKLVKDSKSVVKIQKDLFETLKL